MIKSLVKNKAYKGTGKRYVFQSLFIFIYKFLFIVWGTNI